MKRYGTELINGKYIVTEFNWYYGKDGNKESNYRHIDDAIDEAEDFNRIVERYRKYLNH